MKTSTVAISIDGVLRKIIGNDPIPAGLILFKSLASQFAVVILTSKPGDPAWLDEHGVKNDMVIPAEGKSRLSVINELKFEFGYTIDLVVEPDPEQAAKLFEAGFAVLGFFHPYYSHPDWRPLDGSERPAQGWAELRGVVIRDEQQRRSETRLGTEDE
jgi:hypothetical protein